MYDRTLQALVKSGMEPEWEAHFEPNSYDFRPGRSTDDAIEAVYFSIKQKQKYVLCADTVSYTHLTLPTSFEV